MRRLIGFAAALVVASSALAPMAFADHHEKTAEATKAAQAAGEMSEDAMMKQMAEMAAPNEHHQHLAKMAGSWTYKSKMWMAPDAPPVESEGKATNEMILGGRFLKMHTTGMMMGMPFEGIGIDGYDKASQKHTSIWMDNFGTMTMMFEGTCSAEDMSTTMTSTYQDPMSGQMMTMKTVTKMKDPKTIVFTGYNVLPDGTDMKSMEVVYTKVAEAKRAGS